MTKTLRGRFETRREAEMTIERLVQEYGIDRDAIFIAAEGTENSAGVTAAGADGMAGEPSEERRADAKLEGAIFVVVNFDNDALIEKVHSAFREFDADLVD